MRVYKGVCMCTWGVSICTRFFFFFFLCVCVCVCVCESARCLCASTVSVCIHGWGAEGNTVCVYPWCVSALCVCVWVGGGGVGLYAVGVHDVFV